MSSYLADTTLGITYFFRRFIDRRPWSDMGLTSFRKGLPRLFIGAAIGAIMIGLVFLIEMALDWVQVIDVRLDQPRIVHLAIGFFLVGTSAGFVEELVFRGYVFKNLEERLPLWLASLLTGLLFALGHLPGLMLAHAHIVAMIMFAAGATILSVSLTLYRLQTNSLWQSIGLHSGWNWFMLNVFALGGGTKDALLQTKLTGPAIMVGMDPVAPESGLVVFGVSAAVIMITLFSMRREDALAKGLDNRRAAH